MERGSFRYIFGFGLLFAIGLSSTAEARFRRTIINGQCGSADGVAVVSAPSSHLCDAGKA